MGKIDKKFSEIFLRTVKERNLKFHRCIECNAKMVLTECNIGSITIESCNHLGCMTLIRRGESYETFVERVCKAWNCGEYEHTGEGAR